MNQIRTEFQSL